MKRLFSIFYFALFLLLTGCVEENDTNTTSTSTTTTTTEDFIYEITLTEKDDDTVMIEASLQYVGTQDAITISHAQSPFYFNVKESTRNLEFESPMDMVERTTTLRSNETLHTTYHPSSPLNGNSKSDDADFIERFINYDFPNGHYLIEGFAKFSVEDVEQELTMSLYFERE